MSAASTRDAPSPQLRTASSKRLSSRLLLCGLTVVTCCAERGTLATTTEWYALDGSLSSPTASPSTLTWLDGSAHARCLSPSPAAHPACGPGCGANAVRTSVPLMASSGRMSRDGARGGGVVRPSDLPDLPSASASS